MRLERSCDHAGAADWIDSEGPTLGVERLRARLTRQAYAPHRHDTYTVALTESGVQEFGYRGAVHRSLPGQIVWLHPDEMHDGRAGTRDGFAYLALHLDPALLFEAARALDPRVRTLPFVADPVLDNARLACILRAVFAGHLVPSRVHELALEIVQALGDARGGFGGACRATASERVLGMAREHLAAHCDRVVRAEELEALTGLSRYELCVQFRRRFGTTPHRYLLMRRLDASRSRLRQGVSISATAADTGFADQSHLTRTFKATYGLTPRQFAKMHAN